MNKVNSQNCMCTRRCADINVKYLEELNRYLNAMQSIPEEIKNKNGSSKMKDNADSKTTNTAVLAAKDSSVHPMNTSVTRMRLCYLFFYKEKVIY